MIRKRSKESEKKLREACRLSGALRDYLASIAVAGATTVQLDEEAKKWAREHRCRSAVKNYRGYPAHVCVSVNNIVCHGIPNERELIPGDVVSIDVALKKDGWYGDTCTTVLVGSGTPTTKKLLQVAEGAMTVGILAAAPGVFTGTVGHEIEQYVRYHEHQVIRDFAGHGIGRQLHMGPQIPNFGRPGTGSQLEPGMAVTIEPIVVAGSPSIMVLEDRWSVRTTDGMMAAQFEETILITDHGAEVLT